MSGFDSAWLDLREPADHAARNPRLLALAAAYANDVDAPWIADIGCGTGSTLRAMSGFLRADARWRLVDADPKLLTAAAARAPGAETVQLDLAAAETFPIAGCRLVTASALLDLVSLHWLDRFVETLVEARTALYAALTYDGTTGWQPAHPLDEAVLASFNSHQASDKSFGPALGPSATAVLIDLLADAGFTVEMGQSPWRLTPSDAQLVRELTGGIASAAAAAGATDVDQWLAFRLAHAIDGQCTVGHLDLLALPPA
jgi:hypothetical protein